MVSDYRVVFVTEAGTMTVTGDSLSITVADGIGSQMPQASITLPLKRSTRWGREPYSDLVRPGDKCLIEVLASYGNGEGWTTVLDGIVRSVSESESITARGREVNTTIEVGSFADVLTEDTVAWWMFYGTVKGWAGVRASLTADQMTKAPHKVMFDFMTHVAMTNSVYNNLGSTLDSRIHLAFNGLEANTQIALSLTMMEGPHWQIMSGFLDAPLHELYVTTAPASALPAGGQQQAATAPAGEDKGATAVIWRAAPYVFADENGKPDAGEWHALPVHTLASVNPIVDRRGGTFSKAAIRNFVLAYPAYQFLEERYLYASGSVIANRRSIARFGYRPLKMRTHLILNDQQPPESILDFAKRLAYRVAGQWNDMHLFKHGNVSTTLQPNVRPGERVRFTDPWGTEREFEYHVRARQMTLDPVEGGRMTLNLDRGAPTTFYASNAALQTYLQDLEVVRVGWEEYASRFLEQSEPGAK